MGLGEHPDDPLLDRGEAQPYMQASGSANSGSLCEARQAV
jgi:hypothetical protein